jgi:hypothetical protein
MSCELWLWHVVGHPFVVAVVVLAVVAWRMKKRWRRMLWVLQLMLLWNSSILSYSCSCPCGSQHQQEQGEERRKRRRRRA